MARKTLVVSEDGEVLSPRKEKPRKQPVLSRRARVGLFLVAGGVLVVTAVVGVVAMKKGYLFGETEEPAGGGNSEIVPAAADDDVARQSSEEGNGGIVIPSSAAMDIPGMDVDQESSALGTDQDPIIDSNMTREEAFAGVRCDPPQSVLDRQQLVTVKYWGMDDSGEPDYKVHQGQVVIDEDLVDEVQVLFAVAYHTEFPIHSVVPVSAFGWEDPLSMAANNTSAFNYRPAGGTNWNCAADMSLHASTVSGIGAIDFNPMQNPYCTSSGCTPEGASYDDSAPGTLTADHPIIKVATAPEDAPVCMSDVCYEGLGMTWGGNWGNKDWQHLQKK